MAILEILKFPDPRLRKKGVEVKEITPELQQFARDMLETMYSFKGIGLAAAQVDRQIRLLVADTRPRENGRYKPEEMTELEAAVTQPLVIFNPVITKKEGKTTYVEGCLSVPTYFETVERFNWIELTGLDINGETFTIQTDGLLAICLQHEIDHLNGVLFIDYLSKLKRDMIIRKVDKYRKEDDEEEML